MSKPEFTKQTNLAAPRLGSAVVFATDDFFAEKSRLIAPQTPVFIADKYDSNGKWMDGWESRRKRISGHDYAIIKLGREGSVSGFELDTAHFTGNFPPAASIELASSDQEVPGEKDWALAVGKSDLRGDSRHFFANEANGVWTHVRLHIYPDGGVARLRVYGQVSTQWDKMDRNQTIDLAALELGGREIGCNDAHFGVPENMIAPGKGLNMGDGWETRRRRKPGHDWAVLALAHAGVIEKTVIDTAYFKGNYPDKASLQGARISGLTDEQILAQAELWPVILSPQKLEMDREHIFKTQINEHDPITHIRLNIYPDGGISRLRLFGKIKD